MQWNCIKAETSIRKFSENSRERWVRIGERVMGGAVYSYILGIRHYAPNRFSALLNFSKGRILANTVCESQFSWSLVNLCENDWECYSYSVFAYSWPFSENRRMCGSTFRYKISKLVGNTHKLNICSLVALINLYRAKTLCNYMTGKSSRMVSEM